MKYTTDQIATWSDEQFITALIDERLTGLHPSGPLSVRLAQIKSRFSKTYRPGVRVPTRPIRK